VDSESKKTRNQSGRAKHCRTPDRRQTKPKPKTEKPKRR
jgi:hypothetical protein